MAEFKDHSERVRSEIQARLVGGLNNANGFLINEARAGAPVKSGDLQSGIEVISEATPETPETIGASRMPYSAKVNRGDSTREAKPFWTSAWLSMKDKLPTFFKQ